MGREFGTRKRGWKRGGGNGSKLPLLQWLGASALEFKPKIELKRWDFKIEDEVRKWWEKEDWWKFNVNSSKPKFVIDTPPPYPAPVWHIGAAVSYTMHDMIARAMRMLGHEVLYPIGFDRNGLPIEFYVEKYLGLDPKKVPREEFLKACKKALDEFTDNMKRVLKRLLIAADIDGAYLTDSPDYRAFTQATFYEVWNKGLVYEAERPNNWCPHCRTTIADAEVEYKEMPGILAYIRFKVKETGEEIPIATTRPELLCACKAIIVHPEDERYKKFHGKHAIVPIYGREIPIIPHPMADPKFGTGAMMVCSFGDWRDVQLFRELGLKPEKAIDEEGKMTECAGPIAGLPVKEAKKKIVEILKEKGYLIKVENIVHKVPVHERCETPIEIIPMKEYYLKQLPFKDVLRKYAEEMKWQPERYKKNLLQWIDSVTTDWPISRRRYYATEIPIWTCRKCGYKYVPPPGKYYRPWKEPPPIDKCPRCGANDWEGETRVFDTWMDSSVTVLYITKYMRDQKFWEETFVKGKRLRPQGYDIIRTWLYYTLLRVHQLTNMRAFDYVFINGMGLDEKGRKMSKRYGNVILPDEILDKYGADALRFWIALEVKPGENYRVIEKKIEGAAKFLTKFLNVARYVSAFPYPEEAGELSGTDRWILAELAELIEKSKKAYSEMDFHTVAEEFYHFVWDKFSSHYIELSKRRARMEGFNEEEAKAAWWTLHTVLKNLLLILAPISPAITDYLWRQLYSKESVHAQNFPEAPKEWKNEEYLKKGREIMELNSKVWKAKKEVLGKKLREEVTLEELRKAGVEIPDLGDFEKDFVSMHRIRK